MERGSAELEVDHYIILGLPSGEKGAKLTLKEIDKAYKIKARECHPDKRRDDPNSTAEFQKLVASFELLKDESARRAFDDLLRARRERLLRESLRGSKRRKLVSDLEERERAAFSADIDPLEKARRKEAEAAASWKEELARVREILNAKKTTWPAGFGDEEKRKGEEKSTGAGGEGMDKEKVLKVSWEMEGGNYSAAKLRELFKRFGEVEDVVIRSRASKKKGSALVVMSTKDSVVAATQSMNGNLSNPLLVLPLQSSTMDTSNTPFPKYPEPINPKLSNLVGAGYQAFEDSIMQKLQKAAEKQK